ncbi:hypothetical protein [Kutzneria kofuensis]|uniref:hypothetical protein n=1 Tax=Kutzneria kofuensis TaxID=103725 RepID=UPI0031EA3179
MTRLDEALDQMHTTTKVMRDAAETSMAEQGIERLHAVRHLEHRPADRRAVGGQFGTRSRPSCISPRCWRP